MHFIIYDNSEISRMRGFWQYCRIIKYEFIKVRAILKDLTWVLYDSFDMCFTLLHFRMFWQYMFYSCILRTNNRYAINIFTLKYIHLPYHLSIGNGTDKVLGKSFNCAHYTLAFINRQIYTTSESA